MRFSEVWLAVVALGAMMAIARGEGQHAMMQNASNYIVATQCPVYEDVNQIVFIPHEYDCTLYYVCKAGRKVQMVCAILDQITGERLHFNPETEKCDWPGAGPCGGLPTPAECVGNYKSAHESNCGYYYECVNGRRTLRSCGGGLHFNPFAQICQTPSQAGCDKSVPTPPPTPRPPPPPPAGNECTGSYKSAHENNCGYYYECVNGKKTLRLCGGGLHFNPFAQLCQAPSQAGCEVSPPVPPVTPRPTPPPTPRPPPPPPAGNECTGSYKSAHENNCGYYYECVNGKKTLRLCGGGLHFNPFAQICQTPSQAGCEVSQPVPPVTPRPTPPPTPRPPPPPPAGNECTGSYKSAHENNCGYYYECVNGKKTLRLCGGGLHFNPFAQICQTPSQAGCEVSQPVPPVTPRPTPPPTPRPPPPPPAGNECTGSYKSPHENNCGYYYECVNGKKTLRLCGGGLHFNPFAQICQTPSQAGCEVSQPVPPVTPRPTPPPTPRPPPPPPAGHECVGSFKSKHEINCGFYYECVNGKKVLKSCGGGLHFNPFAQVCQPPSQAGCDKSNPTPKPPTEVECYGTFKAPHETQCEYYYECLNGKVTLKTCPSGLHFNGYAQTCQSPSEAGCHGFFNALLRILRGPHNYPKKANA